MRAPFRCSPEFGDPEDFDAPNPPEVTVYPADCNEEPVLFDAEGRPLMVRRFPFGFCRPEETA